MQIFSFPSIASSQSKILILGTMPGNDSLKHSEYYAHPRNTFWKIHFTLFNQAHSNDYPVKKSLLLTNNIALWDVLKACQRKGSLDSAIIEEIPNDFQTFFKTQSQIKHLFFNGKKAQDYFLKYIGNTIIPFTTLPSTSPAHAIPFEKKLAEWAIIKQFIK
ncbi:MAG: DNA-deoxyinosine glycosylase [Bacteroidia bacterium]